jgi:mannose-6-phosphate isomerase-like protein (cupin superfamily)
MHANTVAAALAGNVIAGEDFVIAEWQDAGGPVDPPRLIAPLHVHHQDDEAWYVLEGVLRVRRGGEVVEAHAGSAVLVKRGTPHTYWNGGAGRLRYLLVMTRNIHGLIRSIHAMTERTPAAMAEVFRRHDSELLG